jgi:transposase
LTEAGFVGLLDAAHAQLRAPIVCIWDNLSGHNSKKMGDYIARRDWLRVYPLPAYASELNPAEGVWANLKGKITHLAAGAPTTSPTPSPASSSASSTGPT